MGNSDEEKLKKALKAKAAKIHPDMNKGLQQIMKKIKGGNQ